MRKKRRRKGKEGEKQRDRDRKRGHKQSAGVSLYELWMLTLPT